MTFPEPVDQSLKEILFWPKSFIFSKALKSNEEEEDVKANPKGSFSNSTHDSQQVWLVGWELLDESTKTRRTIVVGGLAVSNPTESIEEHLDPKPVEAWLEDIKQEMSATTGSLHQCWERLQILSMFYLPKTRLEPDLYRAVQRIGEMYPWKGGGGEKQHQKQIILYEDALSSSKTSYELSESPRDWLFLLDYAPLIRLAATKTDEGESSNIQWYNQSSKKDIQLVKRATVFANMEQRHNENAPSLRNYSLISEGSSSISTTPESAKVSHDKRRNPILAHLLCIAKQPFHAPIPILKTIRQPSSSSETNFQQSTREFVLRHTKATIIRLHRQHKATTLQRRLDLLGGLLIAGSILFVSKHFSSLPWKILLKIMDTYMVQQHRFLQITLDWLADNPLGIKVNAPLAQFLSQSMEHIVLNRVAFLWNRVHSIFLSAEVHAPTAVSAFLYTIPIILGFSGTFAFLYGIARLATWHVTLLARSLQWISGKGMAFGLWQTTWRLFRGRKHNVLRQRTDTQSYDATQLLCGSIVFGILLFFFSTLATYTVTLTLSRFILADWWDLLAIAIWKRALVQKKEVDSTVHSCRLVLETIHSTTPGADDDSQSNINVAYLKVYGSLRI